MKAYALFGRAGAPLFLTEDDLFGDLYRVRAFCAVKGSSRRTLQVPPGGC